MKGLIGGKGTQRVHEQARLVGFQGKLYCMQLEYQGFAAARAHDGKHRSALVQKLQGAKLRIVEIPFPQKSLNKGLSK